MAAGQLEESLVFAQQALDHRLQHQGPDVWWTNLERLDLAQVLHNLDRDADVLNLLVQLQRSLAGLEDPDEQDQQLMVEASELRCSIDAQSCVPSHVRAASFASLRRPNRFANPNLMINWCMSPQS